MKCPKCKETIMLDEYSDQYYCEECGILYDREDLEEKTTVPVLILAFFMWIPIVNALLLKIVDKTSRENRKAYYSIFLSSIMLQMVFLVLGALAFMWYRDTELKFARQTLQEAFEVTYGDREDTVPEVVYPEIRDIKEDIEEYKKKEQERAEQEHKSYSEELINVIDGSYVSGEDLRYLIDRYPDYGYLIQTKSLRAKHQNINMYFNVGRFIRQAEGDSVRLIDCSLIDEFTLSYQTTDYEVLDEDRTIYYIYNTEMFRVNLIYDKNKEVVGMSFSELEV